MTAKQIKLSELQIKALEIAANFEYQNLNIKFDTRKYNDRHTFIAGWFHINTAKSLIKLGFLSTYKDHAYCIRITADGMVWLEAHEAEVGS